MTPGRSGLAQREQMVGTSDQGAELRAKFFNVRETRPASHIYVLLDNAYPVGPDHPLHPIQLAARPIARERATVTLRPGSVADEWQPTLMQLYRAGENGYVDEELIDISLAAAVERRASINGAYVAAWIASDLATIQFAAQLARNCEVFDSHSARRRQIPLYEPHRMALLLDDPQARDFLHSYLSKTRLWSFIDAAGELRTITSLDSTSVPEHAGQRLSLAQCRMQPRVALARQVLMGLTKAELAVPPNAEHAIDALLMEADGLGLSHAEDVIFFALNCMSVSSEWHEHPQARRCIAQSRDDGAPLAGLIGELPDAVLDEIGHYRSPR
jgi:hypothetical protein